MELAINGDLRIAAETIVALYKELQKAGMTKEEAMEYVKGVSKK